jgi:uncharacterized protein
MLLKALKYKRFLDGPADVLFSTKTCGIFQPDAVSLSIIEFLDKNGPLDRERLIETLSGDFDASDIGTAIEELEMAGFVSVQSDSDGNGSDKKPRKQASLPKVSHLVMNVAHSCNLSCDYCYAEGGTYDGKRALMDPDMAVDLTDFLLDNTQDDKVMITFFGGEPLMNFEAIRKAVHRGEEKAKKLGKRIDFALTTNGTLLDEEFIRFGAAHNIKLSISIDGRREAHDRHRKFIDGQGSYDALISKLPTLMSNGRFPARATLTKRNVDVVAVVEHLLNLGFQQVGTAPVDTVNAEFALDESEMERLLEGFKVLGRRFRDLAIAGKPYGFTNIINLMKLFHQGDTKPLPCGAGVKLMAVSPDGDFYICHRFSGNRICQIGSIDAGIDDRKREELLGSLLIETKPVCRSCWAKHLCGGGCYYLAHLHNGDLRVPHSLTCTFLRRWYEFGISIYYDIARQRPEFLEMCAGDELTC